MINYLKKFVGYSLFLLGCAYGVAPTADSDNAAEMDPKTCHPTEAQYEVTFKLLSGNCPNIDDKVSYQWVYSNGAMHFVSACRDNSVYAACTSYLNVYCPTWVYREELTGQLNWVPSGAQATGELTFTVFELNGGDLVCSSIYETTYIRQWGAAGP